MAYKPKKLKQKPQELTREELIKRDALALAELIYDIYQEKKQKERKDALS
jgi:SHS2 domain-containing protein